MFLRVSTFDIHIISFIDQFENLRKNFFDILLKIIEILFES